jgi:hypothetical protein
MREGDDDGALPQEGPRVLVQDEREIGALLGACGGLP